MLHTIQNYLQSFMDASWNGNVNIWVCDGVPGNCTVSPLDSKVLEVRTGLQGRTRVRYRDRFTLLYLATVPHGSWLEEFSDWCFDQYVQRQLPEGFRLLAERTGCKENPDGTFAITACLTAEYERIYEEDAEC